MRRHVRLWRGTQDEILPYVGPGDYNGEKAVFRDGRLGELEPWPTASCSTSPRTTTCRSSTASAPSTRRNPETKLTLQTERRPKAPFYWINPAESGSSKRLDLSRQAALGTRSLVLVDDLLVGNAVKHCDGLLEDALCGGFITSIDRRRTRLIAVRRVERRLALWERCLSGLTGALAGLCAIQATHCKKNRSLHIHTAGPEGRRQQAIYYSAITLPAGRNFALGEAFLQFRSATIAAGHLE